MSSVNKAIILGRCGRDPEVRFAPNGTAVCNLTVATSRSWKDKESGEKKEEVEWSRIVMYDRLAEIAGEYLKKGSLAYFEGRLKTRKWTDKEGVEKYTTEIIAHEMTMLGSKDSEGEPRQAKPAATGANSYAAAKSGAKPVAEKQGGTSFDDMDSDIPF